MIETLLALFAAHLAADFLFQTPAMVDRKREPKVFALHIGIVAVTAVAFLGGGDWKAITILVATHAAMDAIKVYRLGGALQYFLLDQAVHLLVIVGVAAWAPDMASTGAWSRLDSVWATIFHKSLVLFCAVILVTKAGGVLIDKVLAPYKPHVTAASDPTTGDDGLPDGGLYIGWLERGLILLAILTAQPEAVGFLLTAKSILRFPEVRKRTISEYVIIGTLLSFGWASLVAIGAHTALKLW